MNSQVKNWLLVLLTALIFLGTLALYEQWISAKAALLFIFIMVLLFTIVLFTKINNGLLTIIAICISLSLSSCTGMFNANTHIICPCVVNDIEKINGNNNPFNYSTPNQRITIILLDNSDKSISFYTTKSYQLGDTIK